MDRAERGGGGREREGFFSVWSGGFEMRKTKCRRFCFIEKPNFQVRLVAPERFIRCDGAIIKNNPECHVNLE